MGNVMVIPARRQVGNTVKQSAQEILPDSRMQSQSLESQRTAESVLTAMSRSSITQNLYKKNQNGNLPVSTRMMVFPAPTQKSVRTLTV